MMIELHPKSCACHGGSWMSFVGQSGSPCSPDGRLPTGAVLVPVEQWRAMGKPHDVEEFDLALVSLSKTVVTREHERFDLALPVRLWRDEAARHAAHEETATENVSRGGARVVSTLPFEKGDVVWFEHVTGHFRCRAQVRGVSAADGSQRRLHLRFIDTLAPDEIFATSH